MKERYVERKKSPCARMMADEEPTTLEVKKWGGVLTERQIY